MQIFAPHLPAPTSAVGASAGNRRAGRVAATSRQQLRGGFARHVFRACDVDGNGVMDFREFLIALRMTSCDDPQEKILWLFRMYDINRDGLVTLNEVTENSFINEVIFFSS